MPGQPLLLVVMRVALTSRLRALLWLLLLAGLLTVLGTSFVLLPEMLFPSLSEAGLNGVPDARARIELQQAQAKLQNDARSALLQGFAGLLVVIGALATWRQVSISREGQITDRFARAIDQLGSDKPEVRVGGIRALERIATNSDEDRATIAYVLGAFIRVHAPRKPAPSAADEDLPWLQHRAPDVQTAMWVLGRRKPAREPVQLYLSRVDLRSAHLAGARLSDAQLRQADLSHAWMPGVILDRSDLVGADLHEANLQNALLRGADLRGANFHGARLEGADIAQARSDALTIWPEGFDNSSA